MGEHDRRRGRASRGFAAAFARRRLPFALAALLALLVQALAIQTHVHPHRPATAGAAAAATVAPADHRSRHPAAPVDCPGCRLLADGAAYVAPTAALLVAPARHDAPVRVAAPPSVRGGGRSHTWRSRGPPAAPAIPSLV